MNYKVIIYYGWSKDVFYFSKLSSAKDLVDNLPAGSFATIYRRAEREPTGNEHLDKMTEKWEEI